MDRKELAQLKTLAFIGRRSFLFLMSKMVFQYELNIYIYLIENILENRVENCISLDEVAEGGKGLTKF